MSSSFYIFGYETLLVSRGSFKNVRQFWFIMFIGRRDPLYLFWCDLASKHVDDKICIAVNKLSTLFTHLQETFDNFPKLKILTPPGLWVVLIGRGWGARFPTPIKSWPCTQRILKLTYNLTNTHIYSRWNLIKIPLFKAV